MRVCYCCGTSHSTTSDDYYKIDRYFNRPILKTKSDSGKRIVQEIIFVTVCDNCNEYVIEIKRYSLNGRGKKVLEESETLRGFEAYKYYFQTASRRVYYPLPNPFISEKPHSKSIPFIYGKTLTALTQVPRYIDESADAGSMFESKILSYN